ncbi:hypothetical protein WP8S18E06_24800 [Klebsiella sp. WP8-S18-ESBL-06]|nr:hypothetical protein WP8S18E06_24800 [Klebsiella sp. WP8-S18-ESBL-06]
MNAGGRFEGLLSPISGVIAGFFALQKAMQFFQDSLQEGMKRAQAKVMLQSAYGKNTDSITEQVNDYANRFGMDKAEAQQQAAILRQTLPASIFKDADIPKLLETESVFGHQTGMDNQAIGRLNYVLPQIAASDHLKGQDWMQVVNSAPAIVKPLQELTKTKNVGDMLKALKSMSGAKSAKMMVQAMELLNKQTGAADKAMKSMIATLGRYTSAQKDAQDVMYQSYSDGFKGLLESLTNNLKANSGTFRTAGHAIGWFMDRLTELSNMFGSVAMNIDGYSQLIHEKWQALYQWMPEPLKETLKTVGKIFNDFADLLIVSLTARLGVGAITKILGSGAGVVGAAGVGGRIAGAIGKASIVATSAVIAVEVGNLVFDKLIPSFAKYMGWGGKDGTETTHGGNTIKGSWADKLFTEVENLYDEAKGNWNQAMNAPMFPGAYNGSTGTAVQQAVDVRVTVDPITLASASVDVTMPDGVIKKVSLEATQDYFDTKMMQTQATGGGWQSQSHNAGWSPSLLSK